MQFLGYKKKTKSELLKAVDECRTISELCALIQHEGIQIRMQCFTLASNIPKKELKIGEDMRKSPLDNLKERVRIAVNQLK